MHAMRNWNRKQNRFTVEKIFVELGSASLRNRQILSVQGVILWPRWVHRMLGTSLDKVWEAQQVMQFELRHWRPWNTWDLVFLRTGWLQSWQRSWAGSDTQTCFEDLWNCLSSIVLWHPFRAYLHVHASEFFTYYNHTIHIYWLIEACVCMWPPCQNPLRQTQSWRMCKRWRAAASFVHTIWRRESM